MASEVRRFGAAAVFPSTLVVLASDYDALAAENARLRAELAEVKGREAVAEVVSYGSKAKAVIPVAGKALPGVGAKLYTTPPASPDVEGLVKALQRLLSWSDRQVCTHEETHRGGAIWEICEMCGAKWADDEGGKPEFKWPDEIEAARSALSASTGQEVKP